MKIFPSLVSEWDSREEVPKLEKRQRTGESRKGRERERECGLGCLWWWRMSCASSQPRLTLCPFLRSFLLPRINGGLPTPSRCLRVLKGAPPLSPSTSSFLLTFSSPRLPSPSSFSVFSKLGSVREIHGPGLQEMEKNILVTGGAGYIGSHTVLQLLLGGYRVVVVDNLDNSSETAVTRVAELAGEFGGNLAFHKIDLRDKEALKKVFSSSSFDAVIHFAGLKAVGESVQKPLMYYDNNLIGTITLLEVMVSHGCKKLVFSSSATVYGWPKEVPCTEESPLCAMNPYGRTKLVIEEICRDIYRADPEWKVMLLRYFNPVGAHPSGYIGEDPCGIPNNLMPLVQQVAVGRREALTVFGNDYSTKDGTGVRDYIHVIDLADGHIAALQKLFDGSDVACEAYNLGTGKGTSVLEMVAAFEKASGKKIPLVMAGRRPGDAEIVYASTEKAERELNWKAKFGIDEMCRDQWQWASQNPWGYGSPDTTN